MAAADFYNKVYTTARTLGATDTQARLAAAQASLETGYGKSVTGNNYFGIKTKPGDESAGNVMSTTEYVNGQPVTTQEAFRGYDSLEASVQNYMDFMAERFPDAWNAPTVEEAASHLDNGVQGTYATDPKYESKINNIASKFADAVQPSLFTDQQVVNTASDMADAAKGFGGMLFDSATGLLPSFSAQPTSQSILSKAAPFSTMPDIQPIDGLNWNGRMMTGAPIGITAHGTGGMGTPAGIIDAMNKRAVEANIPNLGSQFVMDREGNIFQATPTDARVSHMKPSDAFPAAPPGFSNANMIGIEMITGKDQMLSDAQKQSFQDFTEKMKADYPSIDANNVFTHSELNPGHKMVEEGQSAVGMYRNREMMRNPNPTLPTEGLLAQSLPADINTPNLNQAIAATYGITAPTYDMPQTAAVEPVQKEAMPSFADLAMTTPAPTITNSAASAIETASPINGVGLEALTQSKQAQNANGIMSVINPAVPTPVQRAALADIPQYSAVPALSLAETVKYDPLQDTPAPAPQDFSSFQSMAAAGPIGILSEIPSVDPVNTGPRIPEIAALPKAAATIAGPATTEIASAPVQAAKTAITRAAAPVTQAQPAEQPGLLSKVNETLGTNLTKESLAGGVLGGMTMGPLGGLLGALAGNYVAKNGGLGGLFSGLGSPISINNIGGGYGNVQSVYGGAPVGTQANTNNGGSVTSLPGGRVAYKNADGTVTVSNADGTGQASYFGDTKF